MPIVIKPQGNSTSVGDLVKRFKKAVSRTNIVQRARDRQFFVKDSQKRAVKKIEFKRLQKRVRSLKRQKNISSAALNRIRDRLSK